jgi:IS5 family transposase
MVGVNRIMMKEANVEYGKSMRTDSTVVETDIHYPTDNELMCDCIKTSHRLIKKLEESGCLSRSFC